MFLLVMQTQFSLNKVWTLDFLTVCFPICVSHRVLLSSATSRKSRVSPSLTATASPTLHCNILCRNIYICALLSRLMRHFSKFSRFYYCIAIFWFRPNLKVMETVSEVGNAKQDEIFANANQHPQTGRDQHMQAKVRCCR